jgi:hypothetical protein
VATHASSAPTQLRSPRAPSAIRSHQDRSATTGATARWPTSRQIRRLDPLARAEEHAHLERDGVGRHGGPVHVRELLPVLRGTLAGLEFGVLAALAGAGLVLLGRRVGSVWLLPAWLSPIR